MTERKPGGRAVTVHRYEGGNIHLDRILAIYPDDLDLWVCQGQGGRRVVRLAAGLEKKEAVLAYKKIYG